MCFCRQSHVDDDGDVWSSTDTNLFPYLIQCNLRTSQPMHSHQRHQRSWSLGVLKWYNFIPVNIPLVNSSWPVLVQCWQHRPSTGTVLAHYGMFGDLRWWIHIYLYYLSSGKVVLYFRLAFISSSILSLLQTWHNLFSRGISIHLPTYISSGRILHLK